MTIGLWIAIGIVVVIVLLIGGIIATKLIRRSRRRTSGSPARRIAAAWQEVLDRLREAGHPGAVSETPNELADAMAVLPSSKGGGRAVATALTELAVIVTAAVCAPTAPTSVAAKRAWAIHDSVVKAIVANRPLVGRLYAWIDPRPLLPGATRLLKDEVPGEKEARAAKAAAKAAKATAKADAKAAAHAPKSLVAPVDGGRARRRGKSSPAAWQHLSRRPKPGSPSRIRPGTRW